MDNVVLDNCLGVLMNKLKQNNRTIYKPVSLEQGLVKEKKDERVESPIFVDREENKFLLASDKYSEFDECNYAVAFIVKFDKLLREINPKYTRYAVQLYEAEILNKVFIPVYIKEINKYLLLSENEIEILHDLIMDAKKSNSTLEDRIVDKTIYRINFNLENNIEVYEKVFSKGEKFSSKEDIDKVLEKLNPEISGLTENQKNMVLRNKIGPRF